MISFEIEDMPNGQNISNDQLRAIHEVMASDPLYYDYVITEARETGGLYFLIVERQCPKYRHSLTFFRVDVSGDWGVLYEAPVKAQGPDWADTLDGLEPEELRSLGQAAFEKAFWLDHVATEKEKS